MKNYLAVLTAVCCILCFMGGRMSVKKSVGEPARDTVTVVRTDTVVRQMPVPQKIFVERVTVDTLYSVDTVKTPVYVPISRYIFSDSLYRAEISGYGVRLEKMEIYSRTSERIIRPYPVKPKRFGIGISAGYGFSGGRLRPYIGIGISYNIIMF